MNKYVGKTNSFYFTVKKTRVICELSLAQGLTSSQNGNEERRLYSQKNIWVLCWQHYKFIVCVAL